jgi:hypothetical protein
METLEDATEQSKAPDVAGCTALGRFQYRVLWQQICADCSKWLGA